MSNLWKRIGSAIIFGILVIGSIIWNEYAFLILIAVITSLSIHEFHNITASLREENRFLFLDKVICIVIALSWIVIVYGIQKEVISTNRLVIIPVSLFILFIHELWSKSDNPFLNIGISISSICWVAIPFALSVLLVFKEGEYNGFYLLAVLLLVWIYDSMAYFVGSSIGKNPLFKRISPKKSIEGLLGGTVLTVAAVLFLHRFYPVYSLKDAIILSIIAIIFGTLGDLIESMLKRSLNIKDSGNIMPGHGGILDRFDALYVALPVAAAYVILSS